MLHRIAKFIDRFSPVGVADAHCDIPCGIYDPRDAIQAAQTVIRMTELIGEVSGEMTVAAGNSFGRYVAAKEEHAAKAKHDILVIWTDYFKPEHLAEYPDLHEKVWNACKPRVASQGKRRHGSGAGFQGRPDRHRQDLLGDKGRGRPAPPIGPWFGRIRGRSPAPESSRRAAQICCRSPGRTELQYR